uniref:Nuclear transcription factor Y subunit gamma n=1 Tax=Meloidogyne hapla TaxID=6305 RepID=A0A1I8BYA1_MELHA
MHTSPFKKGGGSIKSPARKSDHNSSSGHYVKAEPSSTRHDSKSSTPQQKCLPITRIRHIMECSPGGEDLKMSEDSVHAMAKAAEAFIELLAQGAYEQAPGVTVNYNHLSAYVHSNEEFNFIQGLIFYFGWDFP